MKKNMPDTKLTPVSLQATEEDIKTPNRTSLAYHAPLLEESRVG
jgi:hypothetical protein